MTQLHNTNASSAAANPTGVTVMLPKSDVSSTSQADPLPWLIRNLCEKQRIEKQNAAQTKSQPSTDDTDPLG